MRQHLCKCLLLKPSVLSKHVVNVPLLSVHESGTLGLARAPVTNVTNAAAAVIFIGSNIPVS